jgi:hypothetical protein
MDEIDKDAPVIAGLLAKRDEVERAIAHIERMMRARRGDLAHIDHVLRLFAPNLQQARYRASVAMRSRHFENGELTKRCQDALREANGGYITTEAVVRKAMADKGIDQRNRDLYDDFGRRFSWVLNTALAHGKVTKIGSGMAARWSLVERTEVEHGG